MKIIKFIKDCNAPNGEKYTVGDEIDPSQVKDWVFIWKANEKGFIEPISQEDFIKLQKIKSKEEVEKTKKIEKEG